MEKGKHEARPLKFTFGKSAKKQTEMVTVEFQFTGGPNDGKRISWNGYFTENAAKRTMDSLEYCGWDGVDLARLTGFGSRNVELVVEEELSTNGNSYPVVAFVNRLISRGPGIVYEQDQVQSLAQRMAALNAERRKENAEKRGGVIENDPFGNG
jgi:hypothetical protein